MLMMCVIMRMFVRMLQQPVMMFVAMLLDQVQPDAYGHQTACQP